MLEIATTDDPRGLRLAGEVDLATVNDLTAALEPHVREGGDITLDMTGVRFLGSSGVQVLIRALETLNGRGRLILTHPGSSVRRLFEVMGLERFENLEVRT
jgi:anti-sigma B factor antagonist